MKRAEYRALAFRGAQHRFSELEVEIAAIEHLFPDLAAAAPARVRVAEARPSSGRRAMTAAQRKAVSERMSKYWAARRAAKNGRAKH